MTSIREALDLKDYRPYGRGQRYSSGGHELGWWDPYHPSEALGYESDTAIRWRSEYEQWLVMMLAREFIPVLEVLQEPPQRITHAARLDIRAAEALE